MTVIWVSLGGLCICLSIVAIAQLMLIRMSLKDAPHPYWDDIYEALWDLHDTTWMARMTAKVTMPFGKRLWPAKEEEENDE